MKRADIPYTLSRKFDSQGLFVGAAIKSDDLVRLGPPPAIPAHELSRSRLVLTPIASTTGHRIWVAYRPSRLWWLCTRSS